MRKITHTMLILIASSVLISYSAGNFTADYTGSTGLGQSCAQIGCHEGAGGTQGVDSSRLYVKVLDAMNTDVNAYSNGSTYTIEIWFKLLGATRVGFQCPALYMFSNAKAGNITNNIMPTLVQVYTDGSGREYMSHTSAGNGSTVISGGYAIWKYRWTAPVSGTGAIAFSCAVNRSNNDMDKTGDSIFISNRILQSPGSTGANIDFKNDEVQLSPNPCHTYFTVKTEWKDIESIKILDLSGRCLLDHIDDGRPIRIEKLAKGNYVVRIKTKNKLYNTLLTKE